MKIAQQSKFKHKTNLNSLKYRKTKPAYTLKKIYIYVLQLD